MAFAIATTTTPLAHLALPLPPFSTSHSSLLFLPRRASPVSISLSTRSRLLTAVAAKEPELGGGGSEGGDGAGGSVGRGGGSDPRGSGQEEGEGEEKGEKKMAEGLSMSQKITLAYAALVGGNVGDRLSFSPP
jgi:hypothetical protein